MREKYKMIKSDKREKILRIIKQNREISRVEISKKMNLAKSNVNGVINQMISDGILMESDEPSDYSVQSGRGRPRTMIKLNENYKFVIGVVAQTDYISAGISDLSGHVIESCLFKTEEIGYDFNIVKFITERICILLRDNFLSKNEILGIAITLNPSVIAQLRYYRFSLHRLEKLFSKNLDTEVICKDSVYAMSFYHQEFMADVYSHNQSENRIFIYISDKVYMVPVINGIPEKASSDRFDKFIFDIQSSENISDCIISCMKTNPIKCYENILIFLNNLLCIYSLSNAVLYCPEFSSENADAIYSLMSEKFRHLEGRIIISVIEKKKSFLGSCALVVNKKL